MGFTVIFYRPELLNTIEKVSDDVINVALNVALSKSEQAVLSLIVKKPAITAEQIASIKIQQNSTTLSG